MAKPEFDRSTGWWFIRIRTPNGARRKQTLQKDSRWSKGVPWPPPGRMVKPPPEVMLLARPFQDLDTQVRLGVDVKIPRLTRIEDFLAAYETSYTISRRAHSVRVLKRATRHFLAFCREQQFTHVEGIAKAQCRAYLEARRRAGARFNTLRSEKGLLGAAWSRAVEDDLLAVNPWRGVKVPAEDDSEATPSWSQEEVDAIASNLKGWAREVFLVGIHCGFRVHALLNLQWRDVRWTVPRRKYGVLVCRKELAKGKREYAVPLIGPLHDILASRQAQSPDALPTDPIWPGRIPGQGYSRNAFSSKMVRAIKAAGVAYKGHECHAIRKTFACLAAARGVNPRVLQSWLAHASIAMTDIYMDVSAETEEAEAEKIEAILNRPFES
jgi:integrase